MHLQLRTVYLFFIILSFLNCTAKDVRLANPATPEEGAKQGVVAFGFYKIMQDPFDLNIGPGYLLRTARKAASGEKDAFDEPGSGLAAEVNITPSFVEIISIDDKNKKAETVALKFNEPVPIEASNTNFFLTNFISPKNFHVIHLNSERKYAIDSLKWIIHCGNYCTETITCNLDVYKSFKSNPIQATTGGIKFFGLHKINIEKQSENERYSFVCNINNALSTEEMAIKYKLKNVIEAFYLGQQIEAKYAEIKFLRDFIDVQKEGYWRIKAEERLAALGYKYENGFVIEVEAKKK
ncbi:MAG TPA: hypothetical protein PLX69_04335 [Leptospiraceae bacterium]|nr:hypothetical protein [Leptospiraceae bacterium]HRG73765.1 hypothetical protein [Leptospiraceae bacterium]